MMNISFGQSYKHYVLIYLEFKTKIESILPTDEIILFE